MQLFSFSFFFLKWGEINLKKSLFKQVGSIQNCPFNGFLVRSEVQNLRCQIFFIWLWWLIRAVLIHIYTAFSTFSDVFGMTKLA